MELYKIRVAIVHDILIEFGGAERVLQVLLEMFPYADLYTFYYNRENKVLNKAFGKKVTNSSIFLNVSQLYKLGPYFSFLKPFAWLYFYSLNLSNYDLVISISSSYNSKLIRTNKRQLHLCYLLTPPKYLYSEFNELSVIKTFPFRILLKPLFVIMRLLDYYYTSKISLIISISNEIRQRVKKYYKKDSYVIYPPVTFYNTKIGNRLSKYYVFHSRLVKQKGLELAINTANKYSLPLVIIGEGYMRKEMQKVAGESVRFLGWVDDENLKKIYSRAKALIYCAKDEDFGIVPIEAMSFGVPVIAFKSGGVKETVIEAKTGLFFNKYSERSLYETINKFEKMSFNYKDCITQAKKFNRGVFERNLLSFISGFKKSHT